MGFKLSESVSKFHVIVNCETLEKIRLANNSRMTDTEFELAGRICDIFTAIGEAAMDKAIPPSGGEFWHQARQGRGPYGLHVRRDRNEIDHLVLLNTRFRDFSTMAYEYDHFTPKPDFWVRRYRRLAAALPEKWRVRIPARFGEIGWNVDGYPVNRLSSVNQERITAMAIAGITGYLEHLPAPRIMEIGAGSGELGYVFSKALPDSTWYDCDLLGCLVYSAIRLAILLPEKRHYIYVGNLDLPDTLDQSLLIRSPAEAAACKNAIVSIPNFLMDDFVDHLHLDLAYNVYSFGEMPTSAVSHYAALLGHFLGSNGVLFDQNGQCHNEHAANVIEILSGTFKEWLWAHALHGPHRILSAPTRTWYFTEDVKEKIQKHVSFANLTRLIESLNDDGDIPDIQFTDDMWEMVGQRFPQSSK